MRLVIKGASTETSYFLLFISIGRQEATTDADDDVGRSSQLDRSKARDVFYLELHWSSFLPFHLSWPFRMPFNSSTPPDAA